MNWLLLGVCSIVLVTAGCASNPVFDRYQNVFSSEANIRGIVVNKVRIKFGHPSPTPLSSENLGMCAPGSALFPSQIDIDERLWQQLSETEREILVFHELAHCALSRSHATHGVMLPTLMNASKYRAARAKYLDELFRGKDSNSLFQNLSAVDR